MDEKKVREAIKMLRREKKECKALLECYEKDHWNYRLLEKKIEACNTAIETLEKQLPKKPIFQHMIGEIKGKFKCPCCNNLFTHECPTFPYEDMEHCSKCGQKLDWSE